MEVICIENEAFYSLIEAVVKRILDQSNAAKEEWISGTEAMKKLRIKSRSTLQKLRDEGRIRFSQPEKKIILYDASSIDDFLDSHARSTF